MRIGITPEHFGAFTGGLHGAVLNASVHSGWLNYGSGYLNASVTKFGDICVLSGTLKQTSGSRSDVLMTLPTECRPKTKQRFQVVNQYRSVGVDVHPDGRVSTGKAASYSDWVNIDSISFGLQNEQTLPLASGWTSAGGGYSPPKFTVFEVLCVLDGAVKGTSAASPAQRQDGVQGYVVGTLPQSCRPNQWLFFKAIKTNSDETVDILVLGDGTVMYTRTNTAAVNGVEFSLSGVTFATDDGVELKPQTGWAGTLMQLLTPNIEHFKCYHDYLECDHTWFWRILSTGFTLGGKTPKLECGTPYGRYGGFHGFSHRRALMVATEGECAYAVNVMNQWGVGSFRCSKWITVVERYGRTYLDRQTRYITLNTCASKIGALNKLDLTAVTGRVTELELWLSEQHQEPVLEPVPERVQDPIQAHVNEQGEETVKEPVHQGSVEAQVQQHTSGGKWHFWDPLSPWPPEHLYA